MNKPMAVLGGGHGAHTMAADLALAGHDVHMYELPEFASRVEKVLETREIRLTGLGRNGVARLRRATTDVREALEDVEWIHLAVPAFGHQRFLDEILPHLRDGQTIVLWPGNFGSLIFRRVIDERLPGNDIRVAEAHTLPYGTRLRGPGWADCVLLPPEVHLAAIPDRDTPAVVSALRELYPILKPADTVLGAAFSNPNPIIHPPGSLLNVGRIQYSGGDFYMYREGITEAVARVIRLVFDEVGAIARALGIRVIEYLDRDFRTTGSIMAVAFQAPFDTLGVIAAIKGPSTVHDRYITEDLPYGLVPLVELGQRLGTPTPLIRSIIDLGCAVCDRDFWAEGRRLRQLGIDDLDRDGLVAYLRTGRR